MYKIKEIAINDIPKNAKLCFIGNNEDIKDKDYKGLICYFTTCDISKDIIGESWGCFYRSFYPPKITKDNMEKFFIVYIKDFLTENQFGVETYTYQKDNWTTLDDIRPNISTKMINSGFGGWLYKGTKGDKCDATSLGSNTTFTKFMKYFKGYNNFFYKYE
jgi:hypothetical protein